MPSLKIFFSASEVAPFAKTGGLADVVGALPKYLAHLGHDVRVVMPLYRGISRAALERHPQPLGVPVGWGEKWGAVWEGRLPKSEVPIYFLENDSLYDREGIYGAKESAFGDNLERYAFLSRGTLQLSKLLGFVPDVFHVHDWMTAAVSIYLNTWEKETPWGKAASVLTIHNLAHQGWFPKDELPTLQLDWSHYNFLELEAYDKINVLKGGIYHSTCLTTVSPSYALEIQTPAFGFALDGVVRARADSLFGILNGIDETIWDPSSDPNLPANYNAEDLSGKAVCKAELQREAGLPVNPDIPLIGMVSRFDKQKGYDVLAEAIPRILGELDVQLVLLGTGEYWAETFFGTLSHHHPERIQAWVGFNPALAHRIEAGSDFFLMPSHFEPCGLNQMYSQRYGTLPIVHAVGGLEDTVENFDEETGEGTGFKVYDLNADSLFDVIGWAVWAFYQRPGQILAMRRRAMQKHFSWDQPAREYEKVYQKAVRRRTGLK
ncbi:MAG: glycogen synthase GlgA [Candidatus Omnitrophica bacterium]|nr:glycogen synthase GlgA [Candidatus Omnitrophota bacterium]